MPPRKVRDYPGLGKAHFKDGVKYYTTMEQETLRYDDPKAKAERKARKGEKKTGADRYNEKIRDKVARDGVLRHNPGILDLERENKLYDEWEERKAKKKAEEKERAARLGRYYSPERPVGPVSSSADAPRPPVSSSSSAPKKTPRIPDLDAIERRKDFMRDVINTRDVINKSSLPPLKRPKSPAAAPRPAKKHTFPTFHQAPPPLVEVKAAAPMPASHEKSFLDDIVSKRGKNMPNQDEDHFPKQNVKFMTEKQRSIERSQHARRKRQVLGGVDEPITLSFKTQKSRLKKTLKDYKPNLAAKKAKYEAAKKRRHLTTEEFEAKYAKLLKQARKKK